MLGWNKGPVVEEVVPQDLFHTVLHRGETLGGIAKWYTGDNANWKEISLASGKKGSSRILLGDVIVVPAELLITREPFVLKKREIRKRRAKRKARSRRRRAVKKKPTPKPEKKVVVQEDKTPMFRSGPSGDVEKAPAPVQEPAPVEEAPIITPREEVAPVAKPPVVEIVQPEEKTPQVEVESAPETTPKDEFNSGIDEKRLELLKELMNK